MLTIFKIFESCAISCQISDTTAMNPQFHIQIPRSGAAKCHVVVSENKLFLEVFVSCLLHCKYPLQGFSDPAIRDERGEQQEEEDVAPHRLRRLRGSSKIILNFYNLIYFLGPSKHDQALTAVRLGACKYNLNI